MLQTAESKTDTFLHAALSGTVNDKWWPALFELFLLAIAAPLLYFPARVDAQLSRLCGCEAEWSVAVGLVLVALLWPLRRWMTGWWAVPMPTSWALWFWFLVMLPVAIWAAPPPLRQEYSWPRAFILIWDFSLFWSVLAHASRKPRLLGWALVGWVAAIQLIAIIAPFGMEPRSKLPVISAIQDRIPRPLVGVFSGAESGFSTNQVAGVLLYVLPLLVALSVAGFRQTGWWRNWRWWLVVLCTMWMGAVMVLTQSRGGLLGLVAGLVALVLLTRYWGWYALGVLTIVGGISLFYLPPDLLDLISGAPGVGTLGGMATVQSFRLLVWDAANAALRDFFFTGMGLGTFRQLVYLLYPLPGIPPTYDLAHAHNFFLQTGLDFGVPGLVAVLIVYVAAVVQLVRLAYRPRPQAIWAGLPFLTPHVLAVGWMGCMVGQTVYSLFDAVAMGSKPNFAWWWWLALIFAAGNLLLRNHTISEKEAVIPARLEGDSSLYSE